MRWRAYLSILRIRMIAGLQYRVASLASIAINLFYGFLLVTILILFYKLGQRQNIEMTLTQGVTYIWFAQSFLSLIPMQLDSEIYQKITSGDFAYELCRPLDLYAHWFARIAALRISNLALKSGLALVFALLLPAPYGMQLPVSWAALVVTAVALCGAFLLSCAFSNLMNILLLKIELGPGLNSLVISTIMVFSGVLVPLSVFPDWLQPVLRALPFAGLMDFPCALYTGIIPVSEAWFVLGKQVFWIVALILFGKWRYKMAVQQTVIQGG